MQKSLDSGGNRTFRLKLPNLSDRMGSRTATHQLVARTFLTYGMKRTITLDASDMIDIIAPHKNKSVKEIGCLNERNKETVDDKMYQQWLGNK